MSETGKPLEIERKYLIKMPSEKLLAELPECERTEILQIYLVIKQDGVRRRIRRHARARVRLHIHREKRRIVRRAHRGGARDKRGGI